MFVAACLRPAGAAGQAASSNPAPASSATSTPVQPAAQTPPPNPPPQSVPLLSNFYLGLRLGYINYPFSNAQLLPGFAAQTIQIPHLGVGVLVFGHEFNRYFSAQLMDIRPFQNVKYENVNESTGNNSVWMNIVALTAKSSIPLGKNVSIYTEGGLGVVSRRGFAIGESQAINNALYATLLIGGGVDYRLGDHLDFLGGVIFAPGRAADNQPHTLFYSGGVNYTLRNVTTEPAGVESGSTPMWPKNFISIGVITNGAGYGVNNFFTNGKVPIFFRGTTQVAEGFSVNYQRNVLHWRRFFAFDWGADVATWKSEKEGERFYTASLYPVFRFPIVRTNPVELYFSYSLAGPTLISRTEIDDRQLGEHFTFQDYMALGTYWGRKRRITAEVRIAHYSNGDIFPENAGITVPLGFYLGTTFK